MDKVDEKVTCHISSHILIRDKTTNIVLLNKNVKQKVVKGMDNTRNE